MSYDDYLEEEYHDDRRYAEKRAMNRAEGVRENILGVIREEYPDGVRPRELAIRMWRNGRVYTLGVVKAAVASLRAQRRVVWNDDTRTLHASDPEELRRRAEQAAVEDLDRGADQRRDPGSYPLPLRNRPRRASDWDL